MNSEIQVCFMCTNIDSEVYVDDEITADIEYILPEITITKLNISLFICSTCHEKLKSFCEFKHVCVENSQIMESNIVVNSNKWLGSTIFKKRIRNMKSTPIKEVRILVSPLDTNKRKTTQNEREFDNHKQNETPTIEKSTNKKNSSTITNEDTEKTTRITRSRSATPFSKDSEKIKSPRSTIDNLKKSTNTEPGSQTDNCQNKKTVEYKDTNIYSEDFEELINKENKEGCIIQKENDSNEEKIMNNDTLMEKIDPKTSYCLICNKSFSRATMRTHMKVHNTKKDYTCCVCDKIFAKYTNLKMHLKVHAGIKNYQCLLCGKSFLRESQLTIHNKIHSREKTFKCFICNELFMYQHNLRKHLRKHMEEKREKNIEGAKNFLEVYVKEQLAVQNDIETEQKNNSSSDFTKNNESLTNENENNKNCDIKHDKQSSSINTTTKEIEYDNIQKDHDYISTKDKLNVYNDFDKFLHGLEPKKFVDTMELINIVTENLQCSFEEIQEEIITNIDHEQIIDDKNENCSNNIEITTKFDSKTQKSVNLSSNSKEIIINFDKNVSNQNEKCFSDVKINTKFNPNTQQSLNLPCSRKIQEIITNVDDIQIIDDDNENIENSTNYFTRNSVEINKKLLKTQKSINLPCSSEEIQEIITNVDDEQIIDDDNNKHTRSSTNYFTRNSVEINKKLMKTQKSINLPCSSEEIQEIITNEDDEEIIDDDNNENTQSSTKYFTRNGIEVNKKLLKTQKSINLPCSSKGIQEIITNVDDEQIIDDDNNENIENSTKYFTRNGIEMNKESYENKVVVNEENEIIIIYNDDEDYKREIETQEVLYEEIVTSDTPTQVNDIQKEEIGEVEKSLPNRPLIKIKAFSQILKCLESRRKLDDKMKKVLSQNKKMPTRSQNSENEKTTIVEESFKNKNVKRKNSSEDLIKIKQYLKTKKRRNSDSENENSDFQDSNKKHECPFCDKKYLRRQDLRYHLNMHSDSNQFKCHICNKAYPRKSTLVNHIKIHEEQKDYRCEICEKTFVQSSQLRSHINTHVGVKIMCDLCGKYFANKSNLTKHLKIHKNQRDYKCSQCPKQFIERKELTDHMRVHDISRNIFCSKCNRKFIKKEAMEKHMEVHSNVVNFKCPICSKCYNQRTNMRTHMKNVHKARVKNVQ